MKKVIGSISILVMLFSLSPPQIIKAASNNSEQLKENIEKITYLIEEAIDNSYKEAEKELKEKIAEENLDYYMTMESFNTQDNPYLDADYLEYIAAYSTAKECCNTLNTSDFYSLKYIQLNVEVIEIEEYEPLQIQVYECQADGYYTKADMVVINEPIETVVVKEKEAGKYEKIGSKIVTPSKKKIKYGSVTIKDISKDDIFRLYGLYGDKKAEKVYQEKYNQLDEVINPKGLSESLFLSSQQNLLTETEKEYINLLFQQDDLSYERKDLISTAVSLVGKVPYEWGGKPKMSGYDTSWWTLEENGKQKGLDCSGFVEWAFRSKSSKFEFFEKLSSTSSILVNTKSITKAELQPGDLGLINNGQAVNHVGIYLGNDLWVHCSSEEKTVVIAKTDMFKVYRQMPTNKYYEQQNISSELRDGIETEKELSEQDKEDTYLIKENVPTYQDDCRYSDEDIYLTAQLVYNEANAEGINGWIAVAEVVKNRVESDKFPDNIKDVIYAENQFADSEKIASRKPSDEMVAITREVLAGNISILGNKKVMYFRNASGSTANWGSLPYFTSINNHQFYLQNN